MLKVNQQPKDNINSKTIMKHGKKINAEDIVRMLLKCIANPQANKIGRDEFLISLLLWFFSCQVDDEDKKIDYVVLKNAGKISFFEKLDEIFLYLISSEKKKFFSDFINEILLLNSIDSKRISSYLPKTFCYMISSLTEEKFLQWVSKYNASADKLSELPVIKSREIKILKNEFNDFQKYVQINKWKKWSSYEDVRNTIIGYLRSNKLKEIINLNIYPRLFDVLLRDRKFATSLTSTQRSIFVNLLFTNNLLNDFTQKDKIWLLKFYPASLMKMPIFADELNDLKFLYKLLQDAEFLNNITYPLAKNIQILIFDKIKNKYLLLKTDLEKLEQNIKLQRKLCNKLKERLKKLEWIEETERNPNLSRDEQKKLLILRKELQVPLVLTTTQPNPYLEQQKDYLLQQQEYLLSLKTQKLLQELPYKTFDNEKKVVSMLCNPSILAYLKIEQKVTKKFNKQKVILVNDINQLKSKEIGPLDYIYYIHSKNYIIGNILAIIQYDKIMLNIRSNAIIFPEREDLLKLRNNNKELIRNYLGLKVDGPTSASKTLTPLQFFVNLNAILMSKNLPNLNEDDIRNVLDKLAAVPLKEQLEIKIKFFNYLIEEQKQNFSIFLKNILDNKDTDESVFKVLSKMLANLNSNEKILEISSSFYFTAEQLVRLAELDPSNKISRTLIDTGYFSKLASYFGYRYPSNTLATASAAILVRLMLKDPNTADIILKNRDSIWEGGHNYYDQIKNDEEAIWILACTNNSIFTTKISEDPVLNKTFKQGLKNKIKRLEVIVATSDMQGNAIKAALQEFVQLAQSNLFTEQDKEDIKQGWLNALEKASREIIQAFLDTSVIENFLITLSTKAVEVKKNYWPTKIILAVSSRLIINDMMPTIELAKEPGSFDSITKRLASQLNFTFTKEIITSTKEQKMQVEKTNKENIDVVTQPKKKFDPAAKENFQKISKSIFPKRYEASPMHRTRSLPFAKCN